VLFTPLAPRAPEDDPLPILPTIKTFLFRPVVRRARYLPGNNSIVLLLQLHDVARSLRVRRRSDTTSRSVLKSSPSLTEVLSWSGLRVPITYFE
jgi:hypothetical protein